MKISLACSSLRRGTGRTASTSDFRLTSDAQEAPLLPPTTTERVSSWVARDASALREIVCTSWLNLLLLAVPTGIVAGIMGWGALPVFFIVSWRVVQGTGRGGEEMSALKADVD